MAVTSTPVFTQGIKVGCARIIPADLSNLKTILVAGANGTLIDSILVSSDDTSARDLQFWSTLQVDIPATATLTSSGVNVSNNDTVTIGTKTYTFQTTLTNVDGNVKIAASAALSLTNLNNAINLQGGVLGTDYATAMTAHPTVRATGVTSTILHVTAIATGTSGNSIASTKSAVTLTWSSATLINGAASIYVDDLIATVSIPANSGFTSSISLVSILDNTRMGSATAPIGLQITDPNGNKLYRLEANEILKVKSLTTLTTAKTIYIRASGADL
jgi:hypothetical protein